MTKPLVARFQVVTPLFEGDTGLGCESLEPAVKRALRFWWRVLAWAPASAGDDRAALARLHQREARLFGSAPGAKVDRGEELFLVGARFEQDLDDTLRLGNPLGEATYLSLTLSFCRAARATDEERQSLVEALEAWSLFGGLGRRTRCGFGSLNLLELDGDDRRLDRERYKGRVQAFLTRTRAVPQPPPFPALCADARFALLATGSTAHAAHTRAGVLYREHRRRLTPPHLAVGWPPSERSSCSASPLFLHVHALWKHGEDEPSEYAAAALYLPSFPRPLLPRSHSRALDRGVGDAPAQIVM